MIKRTQINLSEERRLLSYMITSTSLLTKLKDIAQPKLFQSPYSQTIANWIWEYFDHTQQAPGKGIEDLYLNKRSTIHDENEIDMIEEFLENLSKDWVKAEVHNVNYSVTHAIQFFKIRSLERLNERLKRAIEEKDASKGERIIAEYKKIDHIKSNSINILKDSKAITEAYTQENEFLFSYPGKLGEAFGTFCRGDFLAILGAQKKGKSHYLWYTGYRAALMGLKVIFVSLEMSRNKMLKRMWRTFTAQPDKSELIQRPYFEENTDGKYEIKLKEERRDGINLEEISKRQNFYRKSIRTGEVQLLTYSTGEAGVENLENDFYNLEYYENFIADVIIIDYADIMKPSIKNEYRHQLDSIWKKLRGMAQSRSALVVTGSQSGRDGMKQDIKAYNVAEDYRKLAHVTHLMVINQTVEEKELGVMRAEIGVQREGKQFNGEVVILQCLDIGRAYLNSQFRKDVTLPQNYEEK